MEVGKQGGLLDLVVDGEEVAVGQWLKDGSREELDLGWSTNAHQALSP